MVAVSSARKVTQQHAENKFRQFAAQEKGDPDPTVPSLLDKNHMQLYSYYKPGLQAGPYEIYAEQRITATNALAKNAIITKYNSSEDGQPPLQPQQFEVMGPQFSMDPALINSYYPPDGHQDDARILPHIVLSDPHFPWEREPGIYVRALQDPDSPPAPITKPDAPKGTNPSAPKGANPGASTDADPIFRSMVPWIAVIVFDPDELKLTADEGKALSIPGFDVSQQRPNGTFPMKVSDYMALPAGQRMNYEAGLNSTELGEIQTSVESMTAIFPKKQLFKDLFMNNENDQPQTQGDDTAQSLEWDNFKLKDGKGNPLPPPDVGNIPSFKYLAHVRNINTSGCPGAGIDELGFFSVVVSCRTGRFDQQKPLTQVAHLVSIEHVDSTYDTVKQQIAQNDKVGDERIGMVSLFSWVYTCLPPNPVDFIDSITNILLNKQMLRTNDSILRLAKTHAQLSNRFSLGYTPARWRTETGEETAAFSRGPLVPTPVLAGDDQPVTDFPVSSNTSKEYQLLDSGTGLVDLSYSSAWQLGKVLAISDGAFNQALMRFRSTIYNKSVDEVLKDLTNAQSASTTIKSFTKKVPNLAQASQGITGHPQRIVPHEQKPVPPPMNHPTTAPMFRDTVAKEVKVQGSAGNEIYTGFNQAKPNNSDWVVISEWIKDKLYFADVPAHYLIPDPSFLPSEAIRFFHIDNIWMDCLIDGALSVANHLDRGDDQVRWEIKSLLNKYFDTETKGFRPQVPRNGFFLRSQVVKAMPDLRITVEWEDKDQHHPFCRYDRLADDTVFCLLDRPFEALGSITLAQPPHQQRFALGHQLLLNDLEVKLKHLYTQGLTPKDSPPDEWETFQSDVDKTTTMNWINWKTRCVRVSRLAKDVNQLENSNQPTDGVYHDTIPNSCELGMVLNDPSYYFQITPDPKTADQTKFYPVRKIYLRDDPGPPAQQPIIRDDIGIAVVDKPKDSGTQPAGDSTKSPDPILAPGPGRAPQGRVVNRPLIDADPAHPMPASTLGYRYTLSVYADYKGPPRLPKDHSHDPDDYIPTLNPFYFDLIFVVRKRGQFEHSKFRLKEILIDIPNVGIYDTKFPAEALLEKNYDGPGVLMLANQRFVPEINLTPASMTIKIIPRSASSDPVMVIDDKKSDNLSFRLAEANISQIKIKTPTPIHGQGVQDRGFVKVHMYEVYSDQTIKSVWFVVKNAVAK